MIVKKIYPRLLKDELAYIYVFKDDGTTGFEDHQHLPDGSFDLMINFGETLYQKRENNTCEALSDIRVVGGHQQSFRISYPAHFTIFAVVFKPAFASYFIPGLKDVAADQNVSAEEIFGEEIFDLAEQISSIECLQSAAFVIENFLWQKRIERNHYYTDQISFAVRLMESLKMNVTHICREVGMSERNFRRVFKELTGFSPQKMLQLKRVRSLSRFLNQRMTLPKNPESLGYYDHSHLIHDFKAVSNQTPMQYIDSLNAIDVAFHQVHRDRV